MIGAQTVHDTLARALSGGDVHVLGEALELSPATRGLRANSPGRVHLLPAADATLVGLAVGLGLGGATAVVELAEAAALWGALPQLGEAVRLSSRECPVRLVVRVPCGPDPATLPAERLLAAVPGLALGAPSQPAECGPMVQAALAHGGPVVLLEPRPVLAGGLGPALPELPVGRARLLREGDSATVLAWGGHVGPALDAAGTLAAEGIEVDLLDLRWLAPLDLDLVGQRVAATGRAVLAAPVDGPLLAAVQRAFLRLESPPAVVPSLDPAAIAAAVREAVRY